MMASRSEVWLTFPNQAELAWLIRERVPMTAMIQPAPVMVATGTKAQDGLFEDADDGERWFAFEQEEDFVFWHPRLGSLATYGNRAFALGEDIIDGVGTYALGATLNIFAGPLDWLRAKRDGVVVLDWSRAFDRLREAPRIAVTEQLLPLYKRHMQPGRMPEVFVMRRAARSAA